MENERRTASYIRDQTARVKAIFDGCGIRMLGELDPQLVENWLADQRNGRRDMSVKTSNHYLGALKTFCNWLVERGRADRNPFASLRNLEVTEEDIRKKRRALPVDVFNELVAETLKQPDRNYLTAATARCST